MSSETKEQPPAQAPATTTNSQPDTYYNRKKNIISGVDNDHLNLFLALTGIAVGSIAIYPMAKGIIDNLMNKGPQQQLPPPPPVEEPYIEPTGPVVETQPEQLAPAPVVEEKKEEEEDGVFYETELKRRQKLMGQKAKGSRYDSPFGKDVGGL